MEMMSLHDESRERSKDEGDVSDIIPTSPPDFADSHNHRYTLQSDSVYIYYY